MKLKINAENIDTPLPQCSSVSLKLNSFTTVQIMQLLEEDDHNVSETYEAAEMVSADVR